jgi:hypothetical protein
MSCPLTSVCVRQILYASTTVSTGVRLENKGQLSRDCVMHGLPYCSGLVASMEVCGTAPVGTIPGKTAFKVMFSFYMSRLNSDSLFMSWTVAYRFQDRRCCSDKLVDL